MIPLLPSVLETDELVALDDSTAPTTPEGSLSFSPQLQPQDVLRYLDGDARDNGPSLSSDAFDVAAQPQPVRNICCVGAGFVGTLTAPEALRAQRLTAAQEGQLPPSSPSTIPISK
jgi:UDPglucose 6-dehydrogenase